MEYQARYAQWKAEPSLTEAERAELNALAGDEKELEDRFYRDLEFGTAGLRGILGMGSNRMNAYVVRRATLGLCKYLLAIPGAKERGVAIAYDSRQFSREFAKETALTLAASGIRAYLFESLRAVPQLSFTLQHLHCIAGVVITASHNPPAYNGYKVYWEHGGQIGPKQAEAVMAEIERVSDFAAVPMQEEAALASGLLTMIGADCDEAYYQATASLITDAGWLQAHGGELKLVYTPLHGAGNIPVRTLLNRIGVKQVFVVPEQEQPDGSFPTVTAPNPEDPNAFTLAIKLANNVGADTIFATDPDSDRLGVAVRGKDGNFIVLTGNQIGCLLLEHILSSKKTAGTLPKNGVAVKSIVSTTMAEAMAAAYGVACESVPTGFRFISEIIDRAAKTREQTFLFGFEESYGFLAGGYSRDKDAICAAILTAELCIRYHARGMTLYDGLQELYQKYGFYGEKVTAYTLAGKAGMEKIANAMARFRQEQITELGGYALSRTEDYQTGMAQLADGAMEALTLPAVNMLRYCFTNGAWAVVRPSGTEPKLKLYVGAKAKNDEALQTILTGLFAALDARVCRELA